MRMITSAGDVVTVQYLGEHSVVLQLSRDRGTPMEVTVAAELRPDDAVALAAVLNAWAGERQAAEGLF